MAKNFCKLLPVVGIAVVAEPVDLKPLKLHVSADLLHQLGDVSICLSICPAFEVEHVASQAWVSWREDEPEVVLCGVELILSQDPLFCDR